MGPSATSSAGEAEGLGLALLEAQASGLPLVASNVGGISEVIVDGQTGILVHQKDPSAIAQAVRVVDRQSDHASHVGREWTKTCEGIRLEQDCGHISGSVWAATLGCWWGHAKGERPRLMTERLSCCSLSYLVGLEAPTTRCVS